MPFVIVLRDDRSSTIFSFQSPANVTKKKKKNFTRVMFPEQQQHHQTPNPQLKGRNNGVVFIVLAHRAALSARAVCVLLCTLIWFEHMLPHSHFGSAKYLLCLVYTGVYILLSILYTFIYEKVYGMYNIIFICTVCSYTCTVKRLLGMTFVYILKAHAVLH